MITKLQHALPSVWCYDCCVEREPGEPTVEALIASAERLDGFAETAELMGDEAGAGRFRSEAAARRAAAMSLLDG